MAGSISATTAALIVAGTTVAATGATLGYEMSQSSPSADSAQTTAEKQSKASQEASLAQAEALTKRRGMASTQLTSPLGTTGTAAVGKATLG
jgi:hypothetical protein